jgi:2-iminobutanoate/2-iminopropanoate deaminase
MVCPYCGTQNDHDSTFCQECGSKIVSTPPGGQPPGILSTPDRPPVVTGFRPLVQPSPVPPAPQRASPIALQQSPDSIRHLPTMFNYSKAVTDGERLYLAQHRGFGDRVSEQFDGAMAQLSQTLAGFGLTFAHVVKLNIWLKNIEGLSEIDNRYIHYFEKDKYPARSVATTEFVDSDCLVMVDGVAVHT